MCEFCLKHGEGSKWYLNAKNYSEDLLSDIRRRRYIEDFLSKPKALAAGVRYIERIDKMPMPVRATLKHLVARKMKREHFGQVVPIEDIEKILGLVNSVVRVACVCRHLTQKKEARYCYGLSLSPNGGKFAELLDGIDDSFLSGPDSAGLEVLSPEMALEELRKHEEEGLCHTIWTFRSPFICSICNCNSTDCLAMRSTVAHSTPLMFRAEYVAELNLQSCIGCQKCLSSCHFGALSYSSEEKKAQVNSIACYGCGLCRSSCDVGALNLRERQ